MISYRNILTAIFILFLFSAVLAGIYLLFGEMKPADKANLYLETSKSLLQLGVIVILGGVATSMLKSFEKDKINSKAIHDFRMEFLTELRSNYEVIVTVRRSLRASGLTDDKSPITLDNNQADTYKECMMSIDNCQLRLERLILEIHNFPKAFKKSEGLKKSIEAIESYVRRIHEEYEKNWPKIHKSSNDFGFKELSFLLGYTGYVQSDFRLSIVEPYDKALGLIREELLPLKIATSS